MYGSVQTTAPIIFCLLWGLLLPNTGCLDSFQVPSARKGMQILIKGLHANICATICGASRLKCRKAWENPDSGDLNRFQCYFQLGLSYVPENKGSPSFQGLHPHTGKLGKGSCPSFVDETYGNPIFSGTWPGTHAWWRCGAFSTPWF